MLNNIINTIRKNIIQNEQTIKKYNIYLNKLNIKYKNTINNVNQYFKNISKKTNHKLLDNYKNIIYTIDNNFLEEKNKTFKLKQKLIQKNKTYEKLLKLSLIKKNDSKIFKINKTIIEKSKKINYFINICSAIKDKIIQEENLEKKNILEQLHEQLLQLQTEYSNDIQNSIIKLDGYIFN
tara:strand:- start:1868 stop:2407 length:540 start_codon:yes stop_codon:yes gene_type:complete